MLHCADVRSPLFRKTVPTVVSRGAYVGCFGGLTHGYWFMSTIIRFVINDLVTLIVANLFAVQGAALCLKVLDFLHTGAPQIAAGEAAGTISIQRLVAAPDPKTKCNLQAVLLCQEKSELHLADGPQ